jgi:SPP1 gp7 family putative phage head morphogenesis protein
MIFNQNNIDPTRTTTLRTVMVRKMNNRFNTVAQLIRQAIVDEDVFGLNDLQTNSIISNQTPGPRRFAFPRDSQKVSAFMDWLRRMMDNEILQVTNINQVGEAVDSAWTNIYIRDSYRRGVTRARYQLTSAGFNVPTMSMTGGIEASMMAPFHVDRLGLLYTRVFRDLKGITDWMDSSISRVLAQGLADGSNPRTLARQILQVIRRGGGDLAITDTMGRFIPANRRAQILARTEIIRAHAEAQLQEFKNWGVVGVSVKAEWMTAGDNRVCQQCANMQGSVFTLEQASGMIPLHPQCRCAWLPYKEPET